MSKILITMNENSAATTERSFGVTYKVDEHDCLDYAAALEALGHDVYFVNWNDFEGRRFGRMFHDNAGRFIRPVALEDVDLVWIYQMEGFYADLPRFLRMVDAFEAACPLIINHPTTIRHNLGKEYLWALGRNGVRVIPTYRVDDSIAGRLAAGERFVVKPVHGERGNGVFLASTPEDLAAIAPRRAHYIAQDYVPEVRSGEKSLVFLGFTFQHAVLKLPSPDNPREFRCNESLGGTVCVYEPNTRDLAYAQHVLKVYASLGCPVHYSRIDFIDTADGPVLMEAELLNPAAFANYSGKGRSFGRTLARYLSALILSGRERDAVPALQAVQ